MPIRMSNGVVWSDQAGCRQTLTALRFRRAASLTVACASLLSCVAASAAPVCDSLGFNHFPEGKSNKLYLYFPLVDDPSYPKWSVAGVTSSPAHRFDVSELVSYAGTDDALQGAVFDVVVDDYCEFNVEVIRTSAPPPSTFQRRNTVAIGTDSAKTAIGDFAFGQAQQEDVHDATSVDFSRVWAGTYQDWAGGAGGALEGASSTLERWANSIGGSVAHEAGHSYGMTHEDGEVLVAGEDILQHHLMARGSRFTAEQRAGYRRHFSDNEYSILASNVGLSVQTIYNWDFLNPNMQTATSLRIDFLSEQPRLTLANVYTGNLSPWIAPVVSGPGGTSVFKGVKYNQYQVIWSTAQAWAGGAPGQVAGGTSFHVGAGFSAVDFSIPDAVVATNVTLLDSAGNALALHPRIAGFDAGTLDASDASFGLNLINFQAPTLRVDAPRLRLFRRLISIDAMLAGVDPSFDSFRDPVTPYKDTRLDLPFNTLTRGATRRIPIARLRDGRDIVQRVVGGPACRTSDTTGDNADTGFCPGGINVSLFPATATLLTLTLVDPKAKHWDAKRRGYVLGPLRTNVYYQFAGRHPDLNKNGIDDLIEILQDPARDRNGDGVIDDARR